MHAIANRFNKIASSFQVDARGLIRRRIDLGCLLVIPAGPEADEAGCNNG
jgi:hypothetical protein